jgi:hypothetical protein
MAARRTQLEKEQEKCLVEQFFNNNNKKIVRFLEDIG